VTVTAKLNGMTKAAATTGAAGTYSFGNLNPGTYQVGVYKYGYKFITPVNSTVGLDQTVNFTRQP
jgi:hypothetical protein